MSGKRPEIKIFKRAEARRRENGFSSNDALTAKKGLSLSLKWGRPLPYKFNRIQKEKLIFWQKKFNLGCTE